MKKVILGSIMILGVFCIKAQNVGIGTNTPSAKLDITSSNSGVLIPRVALTSTNTAAPVISPAISTLVYNSTTAGVGATAVTPGFYYWNGSVWIRVIDNNSLTGATTVSNTSSANIISTTVNGVSGTGVNIINSNGLSLAGSNLTSTINGISSTAQSLSGLTLAGDVSGTLSSASVDKLKGTALGISALTNGNILQYNGTNWINVSPNTVDWTLKGNSGTTASTAAIGSAVNNSFIGNTDAKDFVIATNNLERLRIASGGNIGIGTTTPATYLEISAAANDLLKLTSTNGGAGNHSYIDFLTFGGTSVNARIGAVDMGTYNASIVFETNNPGGPSTTTLERMRIDNSGLVTVNNLAGTGNRAVYATSTGQLKVANNSDNSLWTLSANMASSPDDLTTGGISADNDDDVSYQVALPFGYVIEGVTYTYLQVCMNGWIQFETSNGQFTSGFTNPGTLPSASYSNPAICAYAADLRDYGSGELLRALTIGSAPNRTEVINWQVRGYCGATCSTVYKTYFQCEIHENGGINVRYQTMDPTYNGQQATIGFQLAGGSNAKAYPIGYFGKVIDDNGGPSEGWSVFPVR